MTFGQAGEVAAEEHAFIFEKVKELMKVVNNALKGKDWICGGDSPTLADIQLALAQVDFQYGICDTNFRNSLNNSNPHYKRVIARAEVAAQIGAPSQGKRQFDCIFGAVKKEAKEEGELMNVAKKEAAKAKAGAGGKAKAAAPEEAKVEAKPAAQEQKEGKKNKAKPAAAAEEPAVADISQLDLRVGKVIDVKCHPDSDNLYIE
jgi:hypothetical protein